MSGAGPRTTWEDLSTLGWPIQQVYNRANERRGGTMQGLGDIFLNEGLSLTYHWYSYNILLGIPRSIPGHTNTFHEDEAAWTYDNTQNSMAQSQEWTETWTEVRSVELSITNSSTIGLSSSITIGNVAESSMSLTIDASSTSSERREEEHSRTYTWTLEVGPHEKLSIFRNITTETGTTTYAQDYGLWPSSLVATKGRRWNNHYYWGMNLNTLCNDPKGTMTLLGSRRRTHYAFTLVREGVSGRRSEILPIPEEEPIWMVPGPE